MSQKIVEIEGIGPVLLAKRRGSRSLRLSIRPDGTVRVGLPAWAPYSAGVEFARQRQAWITEHSAKAQPVLLANGQRIGKSFRLQFATVPAKSQTRARISANLITVSGPHHQSSLPAQKAAQAACERALKSEAERLLDQRLSHLAAAHGFSYKSLKIKRLTSRWGSCSEKGHISLSYFLVQLPWHLIDYVIVHELAHTQHLNHSPEFWQTIEKITPAAKQHRREIKNYRPVLTPA